MIYNRKPLTSKSKTKTYTIQVTATVEVVATFEIEATSEDTAISEAEAQFEDNLDCRNNYASDIDYSVIDMDTIVTEEE